MRPLGVFGRTGWRGRGERAGECGRRARRAVGMGIPIGTKVSRSGNLLYTPVFILVGACAGLFGLGATMPAWSDLVFGDLRRPWYAKLTIEEQELAGRLSAIHRVRALSGKLGPEAQAKAEEADREASIRLNKMAETDPKLKAQLKALGEVKQMLRENPQLRKDFKEARAAFRSTNNPIFPSDSVRPL